MEKGIAIYSTHGRYSFDSLIPKKNGKGYLKAPFSVNHATQAYKIFRYHFINGNYPTVCDQDGTLQVELKYISSDPRFKEEVEQIKRAIESAFPQITGWKEVYGDEFLELALENIKRL